MKGCKGTVVAVLLALWCVTGCVADKTYMLQNDLEIPQDYLFQAQLSHMQDATLTAMGTSRELSDTGEQASTIVSSYIPLDGESLKGLEDGLGTAKFFYRHTVTLTELAGHVTRLHISTDLKASYNGWPEQTESYPWLEGRLQKRLFADICGQVYPEEPARCQNFDSDGREIVAQPVAEEPAVVAVPATDGNRLVAAVQQALIKEGFNPGAVDGLLGQNTRQAIRALKQSRKVTPSGFITLELLEMLHVPRSLISQNRTLLHQETERAIQLEKKKKPTLNRQGKLIKATHLMAGPSILSESLVLIPQGSRVDIVARKGDFYLVVYRGQQGYLYRANLLGPVTR